MNVYGNAKSTFYTNLFLLIKVISEDYLLCYLQSKFKFYLLL